MRRASSCPSGSAAASQGPLPEYVIDPEKQPEHAPPPDPRPPEPLPAASAADETPSFIVEPPPETADEPTRESLGLPPLTEFPGVSRADDEETRPRQPRQRREASAPEGGAARRGRRPRSASEPGDMSESVDWAGLSSRLSAYSLTSAESDLPADDDAESDTAANVPEPDDADS